MKANCICTSAVLAALSATLYGGQVPDILWRTNANQYGSFGVLFAPDSATVFSYGGDAKQWRVSDRALVRTFNIPRQEVFALAVSPDGTRLVGRGRDEGLYMWRVSDGAVLYALWWAYGGRSLAFSPRGDLVARGFDDVGSISLKVINGESATNGPYFEGVHSDGVLALAFSPDGNLLLSGSYDRTAKLLRVSDGQVIQTLEHPYTVRCVAFSPDGQTIGTGLSDGKMHLWHTNGTLLHRLAAPWSPASAMDFSPDGTVLATAAGGIIQFWRVSDGANLVTYDRDPSGPAVAVDISPDGKLFAYGGGDLVVARMPVVVTKAQQRTNEFNFDWQGGSGRYQVQQTSNVVQGPWVNLGPPTTNTSLSLPLDRSAPARFFRIQSLPEGPQD